MKNTPCLFQHTTRSIQFSLVVDDFGIKYSNKEDVDHLISALEEKYKLHIDWEGNDYIGLDLDWDYDKREVTLSMKGYVKKALLRFGADNIKGVNSPMVYEPPTYGAHTQEVVPETWDVNPPKQQVKRVQQIVGVFLYYARTVDNSILPAVTAISNKQSKHNKKLYADVDRLLRYLKRYPDAKLKFKASKMELVTQADASYLCTPDARSRAGGIMYLGDQSKPLELNGPVECMSKLIDGVVASAAEAEYAGLFKLAQEAEVIRTTLEELGHTQKATVIFCDNRCAVGIANDKVKIKRTKAINMKFHWIRDRVRLGHFIVRWIPGMENIADFFTKPLSVQNHQRIKRLLIVSPAVQSEENNLPGEDKVWTGK